jgi:hypothetical protein
MFCRSYVQVLLHFELNIVQGDRGQVSIFYLGIPTLPRIIIKEDVLPAMCPFGASLQNQLAIDTWVYL